MSRFMSRLLGVAEVIVAMELTMMTTGPRGSYREVEMVHRTSFLVAPRGHPAVEPSTSISVQTQSTCQNGRLGILNLTRQPPGRYDIHEVFAYSSGTIGQVRKGLPHSQKLEPLPKLVSPKAHRWERIGIFRNQKDLTCNCGTRSYMLMSFDNPPPQKSRALRCLPVQISSTPV